ncbi:MAG: helix-turn-helix transcriptional regulator [Lachnospiraceae bacterium]|nr:helix-turn-helix transcriptional regulator [Lachnospiraceae bacterium]
MQINIGEKIKVLRKRDGRRQEDLAKVLGVTVQAVSRWESGGCYPDINIIPAIANYFHVSIDSLFGYNNDRETRIQAYITEYNRFFIETDAYRADITELIRKIRSSLDEFPGETELRRLLALALSIKGKKEKKKPNKYLEESAEIFEGLQKENSRVIFQLLDVYTSMGDYERAEKKAQEQSSIEECREVLLASINYDTYNDGKLKKYLGEVILVLLHELEHFANRAVTINEELNSSKDGLGILTNLKSLYEGVFSGDDYGKFHSDLCMLNLSCARISARIKDYDKAYEYFASAYDHYIEHDKIMMKGLKDGCSKKCFKAPLIKEADEGHIPIVVCRMDFFKDFIESMPMRMRNKFYKIIEPAGV